MDTTITIPVDSELAEAFNEASPELKQQIVAGGTPRKSGRGDVPDQPSGPGTWLNPGDVDIFT